MSKKEVIMSKIRKATESDIEGILKLLLQIDKIHNEARPDIFKGPAYKYNEDELKELFENEKTVILLSDTGNNCLHQELRCSVAIYGCERTGSYIS